MDASQLLFVLVGISIPVAIYFLRENRYRNPAVRWKQLAPLLGFEYEAEPPRIGGDWKGRKMLLCAQQDGTAVLTTPLKCPHAIRLEVGLREEVEKDAGMIVPDRVHFKGPGDSAFEERFLVRATPPELGETAIDPAWRQRLLGMKSARILAVSNRLDAVMPVPTEAAEVRDWLDIASSLADAIDGT